MGKQFGNEKLNEASVLGAQGNLWSEYISNASHLQYMAFPRSMALAECLWTHPCNYTTFDDFTKRLAPHRAQQEARGVKFAGGRWQNPGKPKKAEMLELSL